MSSSSNYNTIYAALKAACERDVSSDALSVPPLSTVSANDVTGLKESEEKLKQQQQESARRENILVMRLATKEQEMQECTVCICFSTFSILCIHDYGKLSLFVLKGEL